METEYPKEKAYVTVIAYIKQLVQDGQLAFGGKLPSEREMMATLGLGRNSIREALRTLENMGLISCVHGKGNFLVNQIGESFSSVFSMLLFLKQSNFDEVQQLRRGLEMQSLLLAIQTADCTTAAAQAQLEAKDDAPVSRQEVAGSQVDTLVQELMALADDERLVDALADVFNQTPALIDKLLAKMTPLQRQILARKLARLADDHDD